MKHLVIYGTKPALATLRDLVEHYNLGGGDKITIAETHARLIAAAPDLLAALEALTECNLDHPGGSCDHWEAACAAIAKARGQ